MRFANKLDLALENVIQHMPAPRKYKFIARHFFRYVGKSAVYWDPWILKDGDVYRLFYLGAANGPIFRRWWDTESKIYGAISTDLKNWEPLGVMLDIDSSNAWEAGRLCAGSAYKENGLYYLFYSAADRGGKEGSVKQGDKVTEQIGFATSIDGIHWQRSSTNPCFRLCDQNNHWYGRTSNSIYDYFHWRDPYIVKDPQSGRYYMFFSTYSKGSGANLHKGACVGVAVADQLAGPYELLPPAAFPIMEGTNQSPFLEMERPQVIYKNGKYHLFFSCFVTSINPDWSERIGREKITDSTLYWFVSDSITGPYQPISDQPIVMGSGETGIYATNFFSDPNNPGELIAYGWRYRIFTLEVSPLYQVQWHGDSLAIVKAETSAPISRVPSLVSE